MIDIGAYKKGANPKIDEALNHIDGLYEFLRQDIYEDALFEDTINHLHQSVGEQVVS